MIHDLAGSSGFELNAWQSSGKMPMSQEEIITSSASPISIKVTSQNIGEQSTKVQYRVPL